MNRISNAVLGDARLLFSFTMLSLCFASRCYSQYEMENNVFFAEENYCVDSEAHLLNTVLSDLLDVGINSSDVETQSEMLLLLDNENGSPFRTQLYRAIVNEHDEARKVELQSALMRIIQRETLPTKEEFDKLFVRELIMPDVTDYFHLGAYANLRKLSLRLHPYINQQLKHLKKLQHLETLILPPMVSDEGLKEVGALTSLQNLTLGQCSVTDEGLQALINLNKLKHLDLSRCGLITGTGLKYLQNLPDLETLVLPPLIENETIAVFAQFPSLKYLEFNSMVSTQAILPLKASTSLKGLRWRRSMMSEAHFWDLMVLMDPIKINVEGMLDPAKYTDGGKPIDAATSEFQIESDIRALERYSLSDDRKGFEGDGEFRDNDMHRLDSLTELTRLGLAKTNVTDDGMTRFKNITDLRWLVLPSQVTDDCIWSLRDCNILESLDLRHSQITDQGVEELVQYCYSIKQLSLPKWVTSRSLKAISELRLLEQLTFDQSDISVTGVTGLEPLKELTQLRALTFIKCEFTKHEQSEIRKQFPFAYVTFT